MIFFPQHFLLLSLLFFFYCYYRLYFFFVLFENVDGTTFFFSRGVLQCITVTYTSIFLFFCYASILPFFVNFILISSMLSFISISSLTLINLCIPSLLCCRYLYIYPCLSKNKIESEEHG